MKNQNVNSISEIPEFASLEFANSNQKNSPLKVDILIGADNYWKFFNNHQVKCPKGTLVAVSTKLGYVLSGSASESSLQATTNTMTTHVLDCQYEVIERNELQKNFR